MANSKITIQFNSIPALNQVLNFTESKLGLNLNEVFKASRLSSGQTAIPESIGRYEKTYNTGAFSGNEQVRYMPTQGVYQTTTLLNLIKTDNQDGTFTVILYSFNQPTIGIIRDYGMVSWESFGTLIGTSYSSFISENYKNAFNLDHNSSNLFTVTSLNGSVGSGAGTVVITANYINAVFILQQSTNAAIVTIDNKLFVPDFVFSNISFTTATTDQSQKVKVNATASDLASKIISPFVSNNNTDNPFSFDWQRGQTINLIVENASGTQATQSITLPAILNASNFSTQVNNSPNGATVVIENTSSNGLVLQYSLDNITFQSSNVFNGLEVGNYTFYVKDQFGGAISKAFTVDEFGIYTPYSPLPSKSNSIRFANRIAWGDAANYKNDENTLGTEVDVNLAYSGCQNFKSANVITTQFKSNYSTKTVKIIRKDSTEVTVPVEKKTNNIGKKDKRDAIKFNLGNGKTGIYFLSGNKYNYDTNAVVESYSLNGLVPEWANVGGYIQIGTSWFIIKEIIYDETKEADVLVISNTYTGIDTGVVVGSIYNDFNYEVYEFTIDMVNYLNQTIQVKIENTDTHFEPVTYLSEKIDVAVNFDKNVEIQYWNDDNTDIFYATGIRHLINVELTKQEGVAEEESDTHKTDTTAILLSAQLYELDKFIFEPVSKEIWRKIMIALSHKNVFINGVQYVKNGNFESEGPLDKSNLYVLKATMLKTGIVYNADSASGDGFNTGSIEIPGLIQTEIGFIKY